MKMILAMALTGILTVAPVFIVASRHFDGIFTDNTYVKSLNYDQSRIAAAKSTVVWSKPLCGGGFCEMTLSVSPEPDNASLSLRIFRPALNGDVEHTLEYNNNLWRVKFAPEGSGWYIRRLDYMLYGVVASSEDSFYF
ncbi:MAG: FixH family protein [Deferribacteraceae bacterium]|jgi:nitrogen fixation protein FixH|nr:FixH family protein [Deferribacteraceae bacterium]